MQILIKNTMSMIIWSCFVMQFDPVTTKDSAPIIANESGSTANNTTQDNSQPTTAAVVTVTPTVAMTTSGGITTNVTMETSSNNASNDSETSKLQEADKGKSETRTGDSEQAKEKKGNRFSANRFSATNDSVTPDDTSEKQVDKNPVISPELEPPASPTGSTHSDSGASQTGVRSDIDKLLLAINLAFFPVSLFIFCAISKIFHNSFSFAHQAELLCEKLALSDANTKPTCV